MLALHVSRPSSRDAGARVWVQHPVRVWHPAIVTAKVRAESSSKGARGVLCLVLLLTRCNPLPPVPQPLTLGLEAPLPRVQCPLLTGSLGRFNFSWPLGLHGGACTLGRLVPCAQFCVIPPTTTTTHHARPRRGTWLPEVPAAP